MNPLDLIRTTHEIDRQLGEISAVLTDEELKRDLADFHTRWRELGYRVTGDLCGVATNGVFAAPKRRGRRRRTEDGDATPGAGDRDWHETQEECAR